MSDSPTTKALLDRQRHMKGAFDNRESQLWNYFLYSNCADVDNIPQEEVDLLRAQYEEAKNAALN